MSATDVDWNKFSKKQAAFLNARVDAETDDAALEEVGANRNQLAIWRSRFPEFKTAHQQLLTAAAANHLELTKEKVQVLVDDAIQALRSEIQQGSGMTRMKAVELVLRVSGALDPVRPTVERGELSPVAIQVVNNFDLDWRTPPRTLEAFPSLAPVVVDAEVV